MTRFEDAWGVTGPVIAEVFVVWLNGERLELTGPCGSDPWYIEVAEDEHPVEVVSRLANAAMGGVRLVHSTSWRHDRAAVVLSFIAVIDEPAEMESVPIRRSPLARSSATAAPAQIDTSQVVEHGLRHLAWLAGDDPVVAGELSPTWKAVLGGYTPEPFRALG